MDEMLEKLVSKLYQVPATHPVDVADLRQVAVALADMRKTWPQYGRDAAKTYADLSVRLDEIYRRHEAVVDSVSARLTAIERRLDGPQTKSPLDTVRHSVNERISELEGRAADHSLGNTVAGMKRRLDELEGRLDADGPDATDEPEPASAASRDAESIALRAAHHRRIAERECELGAALGDAESIGWPRMLGRVRDQRNRIAELENELKLTREEGARAAAQRDRGLVALSEIERGETSIREALADWRKS